MHFCSCARGSRSSGSSQNSHFGCCKWRQNIIFFCFSFCLISIFAHRSAGVNLPAIQIYYPHIFNFLNIGKLQSRTRESSMPRQPSQRCRNWSTWDFGLSEFMSPNPKSEREIYINKTNWDLKNYPLNEEGKHKSKIKIIEFPRKTTYKTY